MVYLVRNSRGRHSYVSFCQEIFNLKFNCPELSSDLIVCWNVILCVSIAASYMDLKTNPPSSPMKDLVRNRGESKPHCFSGKALKTVLNGIH